MSTTVESSTDRNMSGPTYDQVLHALARKIYIAFCDKKNWTPHPFPYVDAGSIRAASIAVDFLGYDDQIDLNA